MSGCPSKPYHPFGIILINALSPKVHDAQVELRLRATLIRKDFEFSQRPFVLTFLVCLDTRLEITPGGCRQEETDQRNNQQPFHHPISRL
ncbi:MAG TPA: hypothetical protein DEO88_01825 [Syntrophobacteraceae bacterium]|nr:hypothetical protein [Syntrophobacteraceae bacterium]